MLALSISYIPHTWTTTSVANNMNIPETMLLAFLLYTLLLCHYVAFRS